MKSITLIAVLAMTPLSALAGVVYRCEKPDGVITFSATKDPNLPCKMVTYQKGDWTNLRLYDSGMLLSAKRLSAGTSESEASNSIWYKFEYPESDPVNKSSMFLVSIKCSTSQMKQLQSVIYYRDGRTESYGAGQTRYAVPDTSDEAVVKFACPKK